MHGKPLESDWKTFQKYVPVWRERYLSRKNKDIIAILTDDERTYTSQFWDAKEKIETEAKILTSCLDGHSRSKMHWFLTLMFEFGFIEVDDLTEFSDKLRESISVSKDAFEKFGRNS